MMKNDEIKTELKTKIKELKGLIAEEKKGDNSATYIQDLKDCIKAYEYQLGFLDKNHGGVEFVNGV